MVGRTDTQPLRHFGGGHRVYGAVAATINISNPLGGRRHAQAAAGAAGEMEAMTELKRVKVQL